MTSEKCGWRLEDFSDDDLARLSAEVGRLSMLLPLVSVMMGHSRPFYTLRDYVRTDGSDKIHAAAVEYLTDLHGKSTKELIAKWFRPGAERSLVDCARLWRP